MSSSFPPNPSDLIGVSFTQTNVLDSQKTTGSVSHTLHRGPSTHPPLPSRLGSRVNGVLYVETPDPEFTAAGVSTRPLEGLTYKDRFPCLNVRKVSCGPLQLSFSL